MPSLEFQLFGEFEVRAASRPVVVPGRKERALLTFLAVPPGRPRLRSLLAGMLWSGSAETQARDSLRQLVFRLRKFFGTAGALPLLVNRESLTLVLDATTVDVHVFEQLIRQGTSSTIARAAALYRGDLAAGLDGLDPAFDEWLLIERRRLRDLAREGLAKLLGGQSTPGNHEGAATMARQLTEFDPLDESAHRALMLIYYEQGNAALALQQYERCRAVLRSELGEEPEAETEQLHSSIRQLRATIRRMPAQSTQVFSSALSVGAPSSETTKMPPTPFDRSRSSIAVLPFVSLSRDAETELVASGLASDLTDELTRLRDLLVVGRRGPVTSWTRNADSARIGLELGADFVLEGTVRDLGTRLQITVRLTDALTGRANWQEIFNCKLDGLFDIREEILAAVAMLTQARLGVTNAEAVDHSPDLEAWILNLRVWRHLLSLTPTGLTRAEDLSRQLVARYPRWSRASSALCNAKVQLLAMGFRPVAPDVNAEIVQLAKKAFQLDPNDVQSLSTLASALMNCELLPEDSIALINRLLAIDPGHACSYGTLGDSCLMLDRPEEAIHHAGLAIRLAPNGPWNFFRYAALAGANLQQNNFESTLHWARQSAALKSDYVVSYCLAAAALALMGDLTGARKVADLAKQCLPGITRESAKKLSPFYKGGVEPFVRGLALAGIPAS